MKSNRPTLILLLFALPLLASATLSVYNLQALGKEQPELLDISYSVANFGFVPYGKTIVARLMTSPGFSNQCVIDPNNKDNFENSFMLIPRGKCEFVTKALNAQKLGAQMVIIMDEQQHSRMVIMTDNNYGYRVKIPAIFINYKQGQLLKELIQDSQGVSVMMKIAFKNVKTTKVDLNFYLQANNRLSYRLVQDFRKHYPSVKDQLNFKVIYSNVPGGPLLREGDCYFNKYCANNLIHDLSATGKLLLDQQLREEVALQLYPDQWWSFMKHIDDHCSAITELQKCSNEAMKSNGIDPTKVKAAFDESFSKEDNKYLKASREHLASAGVNKFPAVSINGQKVRGSLNAELIFDDVCNTLLSPPQACQKYISTSEHAQVKEVSHQWATLVFVVVLSVLIFSLIFVAYRRYMKRKISAQMQSRVDQTVSKYVEFYSERANRK